MINETHVFRLCFLILLFNVITSFFIKMKVRGCGSLLQSICIANLQYLSTEKDLGDKVAFVVFFFHMSDENLRVHEILIKQLTLE